ncbi:MAG TPA: hypothetical protein VFO38_02985 [Candidatus Saccharimonadales bacterium]|nr:hypothetical protein [Candidatus Saccharimonadales bacterium]
MGPIISGAVVIVAMPVAVAMIALLQGTFSWRNPALFIGDPALAGIVMLGGIALSCLTVRQQRAATNAALQLVLLACGWAFIALSEWLGRWQADQSWQQLGVRRFIALSYKPSDIYHFVLSGPLAAIVGLSLIAIVYRLATQPSLATCLAVAAATTLLVVWTFSAWKTGEMMKAEHSTLIVTAFFR